MQMIDGYGTSREITLFDTGAHMWLVSMGSDDGLVPSNTKPFPESMYGPISLSPYGVTGPMGICIPLFYIFIYASAVAGVVPCRSVPSTAAELFSHILPTEPLE